MLGDDNLTGRSYREAVLGLGYSFKSGIRGGLTKGGYSREKRTQRREIMPIRGNGKFKPQKGELAWHVSRMGWRPWSWSRVSKKGSQESGQGGKRRPGVLAGKSSSLLPPAARGTCPPKKSAPITPLLKSLQGLLQSHGPKPQLLTMPHKGLCSLPLLSAPLILSSLTTLVFSSSYTPPAFSLG